MTESLPRAVLEAADISAVSQLVLRVFVSRDLGLWEQMRDCFHDDSIVRISWIKASGPEYIRRSKEMAERNVQASHRLGPIFVTLAGDRAIAQLSGIIDIPFTLKGIEVTLSSHARLLFRVERRQGVWRLSASTPSICATKSPPLFRDRPSRLIRRQLERFAQPIAFCPTVSHPADFRCPMTSLGLIALIWLTP